MSVKERLFSELQAVCGSVGLDFQKVSAELSEFLGPDEIVDYYITKEVTPSFPEILFDVMVLGEKCLYDYEMRQKGALLHFQPLSKIVDIVEEFQRDDYLTIHFAVGELGGGIDLEDKLSESKNIRMFAKAVRNKIIES